MVSLLTYAAAMATLVALYSVQVSGATASPKPTKATKAPKPPKPSKTPKPPKPKGSPCDPEIITATQCLLLSKYKYCDDDYSVWVTSTMEADMSCDKNDMLIDNDSSASHTASGPAALAIGVVAAIWQLM
ncbi:hypothetical protein GGI20_000755 [Coemansia sp. BCRC 34301]|nr:hypothetical protein GGI20_000755 [Coemansia sp. BCRC 34301]